MNVGTLRAVLRLDKGDFDRSVEGVQRRLSRAGDAMINLGKKATVLATAPILLGFHKMANAAGDLGESVNAVGVVFGSASGKIAAFAERAARDAGLSKRAFNELVTPIGAMLQNVGFSADEAADASINLAKRAADMASVFNVDVSEALAAIQAGLRGEADPLERFGVGLSDAAVTAHALEMGLADTASELDANAKSQARLSLLMKQTDRLAGDFVNTSDQAANAQRVAAAEAENLAAQLGQKLLPVKTKLIGIASSLLDRINNLSPSTQNLAMGIAAAAAAVGPLLIVGGSLIKMLAGAAGAVGFLLSPVGLAVAAVAALGAGFVYAYQRSEWFRDRVNAAAKAIQAVLGPAVDWAGDKLRGLGEFFGITRQTVGEEVAAMSNEAVGATVDMVSQMTDQVRMLANDGKELSGELADEWIANVERMRDESLAAIEEQRAETRATAQKLYEDLDSITAEQAGAVIKNANEQADEATKAAKRQAELVVQQIKIARDQGREISEDQARRIVAAMERQRDEVVVALTDQRHESESILARLKAESGKITLDTAAEAIRNSAKQRDETIAAAEEEYRGRVAAILQMQRDSDEFTAEMAAAAIREARGMRDDTITAASEQHTGVVDEIAGMREGVTGEVDVMTGEVISDFDRLDARIRDWQESTRETLLRFDTNIRVWQENTRTVLQRADTNLRNWQQNTRDVFGQVDGTIRRWQESTKKWVDSVVGYFRELPGRIASALGNLGSKIASKFSFKLPGISFSGRGDGPGMGAPSVGGKAAARAAAAAVGLPVRKTSGYRTPARNRAVGGSPTSYHLDKSNPATDWGGPAWALDLFAARLQQMGRWRELLWRTKGHYDHLHVADEGGVFKGPGYVWMGRGYETFASGLSAEKVIPRTGLPGGASRGGDGAAADPRLLAALGRIEHKLDRLTGIERNTGQVTDETRELRQDVDGVRAEIRRQTDRHTTMTRTR